MNYTFEEAKKNNKKNMRINMKFLTIIAKGVLSAYKKSLSYLKKNLKDTKYADETCYFFKSMKCYTFSTMNTK